MYPSEPPLPGSEPPVLEPGRRVASWRWWIHLVLIGGYPVAVGLLGFSRVTHHGGPALTHSVRGLLWVSLVELAVFGVLFAGGWLASRANRDDLLLRWRGRWWLIPLSIGYSVALRLGLLVIALFVTVFLVLTHIISLDHLQHIAKTNRPNVEALVDVSALSHNPTYLLLTLTLVSFVVAGLREELWRSGFLAGLRGLWPGTFGSTRGQLLGVAVAAVIFGLGHLSQGPLAPALTGLLGLGLGAIMVFHRSIWPAVIAHGMFDATTFALLPLGLELLRRTG